MLRYYVKRSQGEEFEEVKQLSADVSWVVGERVTKEELQSLATGRHLDYNIVTDILDRAELSRTEYNNGNEYIFLRAPRMTKKGSVITSPVLSVVTDSAYITLTEDILNLSVDNMYRGVTPAGDRQATSLLLLTIAALLSKYEGMIQHTVRVIKDTGQRLRVHDVTNRDFVHFVTVENNLNEYRLNLDGTLAVCDRLKENTHGLFSDQDREALDDIMLHIRQLLVTVDTSAKRVESIRNAYSTIANNTLNERMKLLTVFTVLIALPNVFYGMYGMNIALPFADAPWAYAAMVTFTILLVISVYIVAKRLRIF